MCESSPVAVGDMSMTNSCGGMCVVVALEARCDGLLMIVLFEWKLPWTVEATLDVCTGAGGSQ